MSFKRMGTDEGASGSSSSSNEEEPGGSPEHPSLGCGPSLDSLKVYVLVLLLGAFLGALLTICVFYVKRKKARNNLKFENNLHQAEEEENIYQRDSRASSIHANPSRQGSARTAMNGGSRRMSKTQSLLEQELRRSPMAPPGTSNTGGNNGCLNCKLIIMGESISYADGRCPQCGDDQEQRRLK